MKIIKAWAFLGGKKGGRYFITDLDEMTEVYLKKPKPIHSPFDYFTKKNNWKPTEIEITIK